MFLLLEVNGIISFFGLQGITGPRGTFHFTSLVSNWCSLRLCGMQVFCHQKIAPGDFSGPQLGLSEIRESGICGCDLHVSGLLWAIV